MTVFRDAAAFNGDVSKWRTGAVTNMYQSTCFLFPFQKKYMLSLFLCFLIFGVISIHSRSFDSHFEQKIKPFCEPPKIYDIFTSKNIRHYRHKWAKVNNVSNRLWTFETIITYIFTSKISCTFGGSQKGFIFCSKGLFSNFDWHVLSLFRVTF